MTNKITSVNQTGNAEEVNVSDGWIIEKRPVKIDCKTCIHASLDAEESPCNECKELRAFLPTNHYKLDTKKELSAMIATLKEEGYVVMSQNEWTDLKRKLQSRNWYYMTCEDVINILDEVK